MQKKILLVSLDFDQNKKIESFIKKHKSENIQAIALFDENIINKVSDIFTERGWLGSKQADRLKSLFQKKAERKARDWLDYIGKIERDYNLSISKRIEKLTIESFIHTLTENVSYKDIKSLAFSFKSGLNPTYDACKPYFEKLRNAESVSLFLLR
ncbi:MAG TPA: hypothetical protein P5107_11065 [Thermotogota bacterium]|nr:hypothetical protein [Thermotogota bacterium]